MSEIEAPDAPPEAGEEPEIQGAEVEGDRVRYIKVQGGTALRVIVDFSPDGSVTFWDQEPGETRWYQCQPSPKELELVQRLRTQATDRQCPYDSHLSP